MSSKSARQGLHWILVVVCPLVVGLAASKRVIVVPTASQTTARPDAPRGQAGNAARGEYLVHSVAMCVQCHSPRDDKGQLIKENLFEGGPIPVPAPARGPEWATTAPNIKGLPGSTDEEEIRLLTTGINRRG